MHRLVAIGPLTFALLMAACPFFFSQAECHSQDSDLPELLETFRKEFVEIKPGEGDFPKSAHLNESGSKTIQNLEPRSVQLSTPFWMGKYEVTQDLWEAVMGSNPSRWKGPRNSVELLSFSEAVEFCERVTVELRKAGLITDSQLVRLPTEVEWEYVCRAGTTTRYYFGDDETQLDDHAWHTGNAAGNDPPVGVKDPNPFGLYDIHGYLSEWCLSDVGEPDRLVTPTLENWSDFAHPTKAALRGGSWKDSAGKLASGYRVIVDQENKDDAVGLRCVLVAVSGDNGRVADSFNPTSQSQFVPEDSDLEILWAEGEFTEGPAAAPDGSIYFSDIGNRMMRFSPESKTVEVVREPSRRSNGLAFDRDGTLVICEGANTGGGRRISRMDTEGNVTTVAETFEGNRFNSPNDLVIDPAGNIYFSDPRYTGDQPRELEFEAVLRISTDGEVSIATRDLAKPNGLLISPDGKTAYVAENNPIGEKLLLAFDVNQDGTFEGRRTLFDFGSGRGIDGMAMDHDGNIYATAGRDELSGIYIFSPTGKQLALIPLPGAPTNCCFGGKQSPTMLYITAAAEPPSNQNEAQKYALYRINVAVEGLTR